MLHLRLPLRQADRPGWAAHGKYSRAAAFATRQAYARTNSPRVKPSDWLDAIIDVGPWLDASIAPPQQIRIKLVFARTHETEGDYTAALSYVDRALEIAGRAHLLEELTSLLLYRAKLERMRLRYEAAAGDVQSCLALVYERADMGDTWTTSSLQVEALAQLATYEFFGGQFDIAEQLANQALQLAPQAPEARLALADVWWTHARLDRLRNRTQEAISATQQAATIYERLAPLSSQGRLHAFLADLHLDRAERIPPGPAARLRTPFLRQASRQLEIAEKRLSEANDRLGRGLAQLTRIRLQRLRGANTNRVKDIEEVLHMAWQCQDHALAGQALTLLGDELATQDRQEQAHDCYHQTIAVLHGKEVPALQIIARRKLLYAQEMSADDGTNGDALN